MVDTQNGVWNDYPALWFTGKNYLQNQYYRLTLMEEKIEPDKYFWVEFS